MSLVAMASCRICREPLAGQFAQASDVQCHSTRAGALRHISQAHSLHHGNTPYKAEEVEVSFGSCSSVHPLVKSISVRGPSESGSLLLTKCSSFFIRGFRTQRHIGTESGIVGLFARR